MQRNYKKDRKYQLAVIGSGEEVETMMISNHDFNPWSGGAVITDTSGMRSEFYGERVAIGYEWSYVEFRADGSTFWGVRSR